MLIASTFPLILSDWSKSTNVGCQPGENGNGRAYFGGWSRYQRNRWSKTWNISNFWNLNLVRILFNLLPSIIPFTGALGLLRWLLRNKSCRTIALKISVNVPYPLSAFIILALELWWANLITFIPFHARYFDQLIHVTFCGSWKHIKVLKISI